MKVWLDDERPAPVGWTHVRTYNAAVSLIDRCLFTGERIEEMSLDHDLADFDPVWGHERDGYDLLVHIEWMVRNGDLPYLPRLYVHSANPPARKRMEAAIRAIRSISG